MVMRQSPLSHTPFKSMLTGQQLLDTVQSMPNASKAQLCQATGYTSTSESGKTKMLWNALQTALLAAKGVNLPTGAAGGPRPSFRTQVLSTNRTVVVGKCYIEMLGIEPGTPIEIEVDAENRQLILSAPLD